MKKFIFTPRIENYFAILICLICGILMASSLHKLNQINDSNLDVLILKTEEHYNIGYNLYTSGELSLFGYASIFRAPGYPVFVALSLHTRDFLQFVTRELHIPISAPIFNDTFFLMEAQLVIALIGGFFFFKALRHWLNLTPSILFTVAFLVNPLTLALIRILSYPVLDLVMITISISLCANLVRKENINKKIIISTGIFFALAALIRPIFLTSPVLIFGILWLVKKIDIKRSIVLTALFSIFMLGAISPYSFRNLAVSGRFILINNQGPWAFWGNSVKPFYSTNRLPLWVKEVWEPFGQKLFSQVTKEEYSLESLYRYSNELSEKFSHEFFNNLISRPSVYLKNVLKNFFYITFWPREHYENHFWRLVQGKKLLNPLNPLRYVNSSFYQAITIIVIPLLGILSYRKSQSAKLGVMILFYWVASYSFTILNARYLYFIQPVVLFSLAIVSGGVVSLFKTSPNWFSSSCSLIVSTFSAIILSSPIVYLLLIS